MSTLKVNTVQHNTSGFNNVVQFTDGGGTENGTLCRAWVNFNGAGTVAIRADFNVSSITDNGTGDYTVNFSNAMPNSNYCVQVGGNNNDAFACGVNDGRGAPTTSLVYVATNSNGGGRADCNYTNVTING